MCNLTMLCDVTPMVAQVHDHSLAAVLASLMTMLVLTAQVSLRGVIHNSSPRQSYLASAGTEISQLAHNDASCQRRLRRAKQNSCNYQRVLISCGSSVMVSSLESLTAILLWLDKPG